MAEVVEVCKDHYFEGVEKLLEISFCDSPNKDADLRDVSSIVWEELLKKVKCEIISCSRNDHIDAYVLSESSMFIFKKKWILKTCGTTTPLHCLKGLLEIAHRYGYDEIADLFYSRKNFTRPEKQLYPHRGFCEEVAILDSIFADGRSYCLGSINSECWYLYTFTKPLLNNVEPIKEIAEPDQTIEILMQNLDAEVMSIFTKEISKTPTEATVNSKIDQIIPDMLIDDLLFEPCGYSMNGIRNNGEYMTIHITPEKDFSYVSFESNVALSNYTDLINRVIKTFKPSKFIVTVFANKTSEAYATIKDLDLEYTKVKSWKRTDMQCCNFPSYNLLFAQYAQNVLFNEEDDA
ncbi:S-adenosylmethionine decarboxylase proenzyme [Teleopsis dalmanni]|uniref:S-adenosylmethionine decarboxylase proenzyme n=1 Tax=Teleopsis dalmanni TaxID=139649 RepID=UPI0018CF674F|nr:S-adenosylmethionine decarboxylase proenzyme [Teleopsis dalmanni]